MARAQFILAAVGPLIVAVIAVGSAAHATDRLTLNYAWTDDGGCTQPTERLSLTYQHESSIWDAYGTIRQEPSGGDCRKEKLNGDVWVQRKFPLTYCERFDCNGVVKIGANRVSVSGPYAVDGELRDDGRPLRLITLPAGVSSNWMAVVGANLEWHGWTGTLGANLVEIPFADGESERTLHVAFGTEVRALWGVVELAADFDTDLRGHAFGSNRMVWRSIEKRGELGLSVGVHHDWGLQQHAAEVPDRVDWYGREAVAWGSVEDEALRFVVGAMMEF